MPSGPGPLGLQQKSKRTCAKKLSSRKRRQRDAWLSSTVRQACSLLRCATNTSAAHKSRPLMTLDAVQLLRRCFVLSKVRLSAAKNSPAAFRLGAHRYCSDKRDVIRTRHT